MANSYIRKRTSDTRGTRFYATHVSKDPATGGRITQSKTFNKNGAAQAWIAKKITEAGKEDGSKPVKPSKMKLSEFVEIWKAEFLPKKKPTTADSYAEIMRNYIIPAIGGVELRKISTLIIQRKIVNAMETRGLHERTIRYSVTVLRIALKFAISLGHLPKDFNPAASGELEFIESEEREPVAFEKDQVLSFFEVSDLDPYSALWRVLFATGVRPSEAFGLTREDVDLEKGRIHIRRALRWTRDEDGNRIHVLGLPKTKKSKREIRIGPKLAGILRAHLETVEDDPGALVFLSKKSSKNPGGGPLDRNNIAKRFLRIAKTAGLADLGASLYSARHTFCTLQLAAGTHYKAVAAAMGHKSPSLVLERYSHALPSQLDTVADTMDAML